VQFIEELCDVVTANQRIPDMWQLAHAYFSEKLVENLSVSKETLGEQEDKCKEMLRSLLDYFTDLLRLAFFPAYLNEMSEDHLARLGPWTPFDETKQEAAGAWLPFCVRHVRSCFSSLSRLQLPREVLKSFREFVVDLRLHCTMRLFEQAKKDINGLKAREDWCTEIDEYGCITSLPVLFENICMEVLLGVKEVVMESKPGENPRSPHVQALQREASDQLTECFHVFVDVLDELAFYQESTQQGRPGPTQYTVFPSTETLGDTEEDNTPPSRERQLLMVLSNCDYTKVKVLPKLIECFKNHGYANYKYVTESAQHLLEELSLKVITVYIDSKELPIVGTLEPAMQAGDWDWEECLIPTEVRGYVKDTLLKLVRVHAEVYSVVPIFVVRILSKIIEAMVAEVTRVLQCVPGFGENGAMQARLELSVLEKALSKCLTAGAKAHLDEAFHFLPPLANEEKSKLIELQVKAFMQKMTFELVCFKGVPLKDTIGS
jgi:exocyst complex component 2